MRLRLEDLGLLCNISRFLRYLRLCMISIMGVIELCIIGPDR